MDSRADLLAQLGQAERHVAQCIRHVERQRELIEDAAHNGLDTLPARQLLTLLEEAQALRLADRDQLIKELGKLPLSASPSQASEPSAVPGPARQVKAQNPAKR